MRTLRPIVASLLLTTACGAQSGPEEEVVDEGPRDIGAPKIVVQSPTRGSQSEGQTVVVEGVATDDEGRVAKVIVAGIETSVDESGRFQVEVPLESGVQLIQTLAYDEQGNEASDTRAILSGEFGDPRDPVEDAAQIYLGNNAFETMGEAAVDFLNSTAIEPFFDQMNPVYTSGGSCLGSEVNLESFSYDDLDISVTPRSGGMRAIVTLTGVEMDMRANYDVACIGGSALISADANSVTLDLGVDLSLPSKHFAADLSRNQITVNNVDVDVGILPSEVIEFVVGDLDMRVAGYLEDIVAIQVPPRMEDMLEGMNLSSNVSVMGVAMSISAEPTAASFTSEGGLITLNTKIESDGASPYPLSQVSPPTIATDSGVAMVVADDAINQALSALWSAGSLNQRMRLEQPDGTDLGAGILNEVDIKALLPPVVSATGTDGHMVLRLGDLIVGLLKDDEESASQVAVSIEVAVGVESIDGELHFATSGEPSITWDRLDTDGFMADRDIELVVALASTLIEKDLESVLGTFPLPSFAGINLIDAEIQSKEGYLNVKANLQR